MSTNDLSVPGVNDHGFNRRDFLRTAALSGAAAAWGSTAASAESPSSSSPVTSLLNPSSTSPSASPLAPPDKQAANLEIPQPEKKLGWAVVGLGELSLGEILPAFGSCKTSRLTGLVSGHRDKARQLAEVYGVDAKNIYNYDNFDQIRDNPAIDVVYIVLPNSLHAEFTIRALKAGKHVLCEKPMAVTVDECQSMMAAAAAANRTLGVAYRLHYEPMNRAVMEMCKTKPFGAIKTFTASNCQDVKAPNIRLSGPLGGGPVGDVGVYCINAARYTIGEEPIEVSAISRQPTSDPRFREVPETVSFLLRYASGIIAECECSFGTARSSRYQVLCEKGSIVMDPAYTYAGLRLFTNSSTDGIPERKELLIPAVDQFASEMDSFSNSLLKGTPFPTTGEMGLKDLRICLAVLESARLGGQPVKIS